MVTSHLLLTLLAAAAARAQSSAGSSEDSSASSTTRTSSELTFNFASASTVTNPSVAVPTGSYLSYTTQITVATQSSLSQSSGTIRSSNATATTSSSTSNTLLLQGTNTPVTLNGTATATATGTTPSNTQACNNYPEFCSRRYMNFTEVCAHNSAFAVKNNVASNQQYSVTMQLNDGIRMIQGETHWFNNDIYSCHTSCDILNAGTLEAELATVADWVEAHPYDVVTILLVNSDYRNISDYVNPIQNSGLAPYLYVPPKIPMHRDDWPILGDMIISAKRVVIFMDYMANQTEVPYVLDEFSQLWETPFSPTDADFPCTQERPPGLNSVQQDLVPYLANHNLNLQLSLAGTEILIPAYSNLTQVNAVSGNSSAGQMMTDCVAMWDRPPAWLLVDFYNQGEWDGANDTGAVFEVAARFNGVNYTRSCCGSSDTSGASSPPKSSLGLIAAAIFSIFVLI